MQYYIYTTCGTSTFTNLARRKDPELNELIIKNSNAQDCCDFTSETKERIDSLYKTLEEEWENYSASEARAKSAELNCLLCWQEKNHIKASDCFCALLFTDTVLGLYAATLVEKWLKKNGYEVVCLLSQS